MTVLLPGRTELVDGLIPLLPPELQTIRDPDATAVTNFLRINSVPFVVKIEDGVVSSKAYLRRVTDLLDFIGMLSATHSEISSTQGQAGVEHVGQ